MLINTLANHIRSKRKEPLTIEMLQGELREVKALRPKDATAKFAKKIHISALKSMIIYKQKENEKA
jgi:hypothetical protein